MKRRVIITAIILNIIYKNTKNFQNISQLHESIL
jgi:hypothetical protein